MSLNENPLKPVRVVNKNQSPKIQINKSNNIEYAKKVKQTKSVESNNIVHKIQGNNVVKAVGSKRPVIIKRRERNVNADIKGKPSPSISRTRLDDRIAPHIDRIKSLRNKGYGRVLILIACGPSVKEVEDIADVVNHPLIDTMCINKPEMRVWPATYWSFCDNSQYSRNQDTHKTYTGIVFNSPSIKVGHRSQIIIRNRRGMGFSRDLATGYHIGRSTTYASMQIAYYLNYDRVYILGCDMGEVPGLGLWHYGDNPDVDNKIRVERFAKEAEHYNYASNFLSDHERSKFYFCSSYNKWPFVNKFNTLDHRISIKHAIEYADGLKQK